MDKQIVLFGAGGQAKVVLDILQLNGWNVVGVLEGAPSNHKLFEGYQILGSDDLMSKVYLSGVQCAALGIGQIGNYKIREKVYRLAKEVGFLFPNLIHPKAVIDKTVSMGEGNVIGAGVVINSNAFLGNIDIMNTNSTIEHDVTIEDNVHVAPGSVVLGGVSIGKYSLLGANSTILQNKTVGKCVTVGAGSVVLENVADGMHVAGNPARVISGRNRLL